MLPTSQMTRRQILQAAGPLVAGAALASLPAPASRADTPKPQAVKSPDEVLRQLVEGNRRFAKGEARQPRRTLADIQRGAEGQSPGAIIISCSDSRVPPELLFDQGIGDLFVVRVAGNVVNGAGAIVIGSIEYAVAELNASLVVVLGHSQCGAIKTALKFLDSDEVLPGALDDLVHLVKPAVSRVKDKPGDRLENAIKANVAAGVARLMNLRPILSDRVKMRTLRVVGGVYELKTGLVIFRE